MNNKLNKPITLVQKNSINLSTLVFLIFLVLKLAGIGQVATWSWWWVTSPLWIPILLVAGFLLVGVFIALIGVIFFKD